MTKAKIRLKKRLLGYDIFVDSSGVDDTADGGVISSRPAIIERISDFIGEVRSYLLDKGLPDPLRIVSLCEDSGWCYRDISDASTPEIYVGYEYAAKHLELSDELEKIIVLFSHALDFLAYHKSGDIAEAYQSLFDFTQAYTLYWAEIDARPDMERGQATVRAASSGGEVRAKMYHPRNSVIIREIAELKGMGHTAKRAAELVAKRGFGSSAGANLQVWNRHLRKL